MIAGISLLLFFVGFSLYVWSERMSRPPPTDYGAIPIKSIVSNATITRKTNMNMNMNIDASTTANSNTADTMSRKKQITSGAAIKKNNNIPPVSLSSVNLNSSNKYYFKSPKRGMPAKSPHNEMVEIKSHANQIEKV